MRMGPITFFLLLFAVFRSADALSQDLYREKIYLHLDKGYYQAGGTVWFSAYQVDAASGRPADWELGVLRAALLDGGGNERASATVHLEDGRGQGQLELAADLPPGSYRVVARTRYMRNFSPSFFFSREIYVASDREAPATPEGAMADEGRPDLQFFPEGGELVSGLATLVGLKLTGTDGMGLEGAGRILDDKGQTVAPFSTKHRGMGALNVLADAPRTYTAELFYKGDTLTYPFPRARATGVRLRLRETADAYRVGIEHSAGGTLDGYVLRARQGNGEVYSAGITGGRAQAMFNVPKEELRTGIVQFTLFGPDDDPLCERLAFRDRGDAVTVAVSAGPRGPGDASPVKLLLRARKGGLPMATGASLSVGVTERAAAPATDAYADIRTYLLLGSELRGRIEDPGHYFKTGGAQRKTDLDLLMLTQGWRSFILDDVPPPGTEPYDKRYGITVRGSVADRDDRNNGREADIILSRVTANGPEALGLYPTDGEGRFDIDGLDLEQGAQISLNVLPRLKTGKKLSIRLDTLRPGIGPYPVLAPTPRQGGGKGAGKAPKEKPKKAQGLSPDRFMAGPEERKAMDLAFFADRERLIRLDEVEVSKVRRAEVENPRGIEMVEKRRNSIALYSYPSGTIDFSEIPIIGSALHAFLYRPMVGVRANTKSDGTIALGVRGGRTIFLLDGFPVPKEVIDYTPASEVDFIDVLKNRGSVYGGGSVVALYTRDGSEESFKKKSREKNLFRFRHWGYTPVRRFYEPRYGAPGEGLPYDTTVGWAPLVTMDANGNAEAGLPPMRPGSYRAIVQGLTAEGRPVTGQYDFEVE